MDLGDGWKVVEYGGHDTYDRATAEKIEQLERDHETIAGWWRGRGLRVSPFVAVPISDTSQH
jgi:hypothetical protein